MFENTEKIFCQKEENFCMQMLIYIFQSDIIQIVFFESRRMIFMKKSLKQKLAVCLLATSLFNKSNTNAANPVGSIFKYVLGGVGLILTAGAAVAIVHCIKNYREKQQIMKIFEKVPSVYDLDEKSLGDIWGDIEHGDEGYMKRYFEKVLETSKNLSLTDTTKDIEAIKKSKNCKFSIPVLAVLASDLWRTIKKDKNIVYFGVTSEFFRKIGDEIISYMYVYDKSEIPLVFCFKLHDSNDVSCLVYERAPTGKNSNSPEKLEGLAVFHIISKESGMEVKGRYL